MNKISTLAGETVLYGLGSIIPRALNFLLFPIHTRIFNPSEYGVVSYLYIVAAFLNIVFTFGMETAYFRYATKGKYSTTRIFRLAQTAVVFISVVLGSLMIVFADSIATSIALPGKAHYIVWLAGIVFIDAIAAIPFASLRLQKKPLQFAFGKIINVLILVGLNVYFFVIANRLDGGANAQVTCQPRYGIEYIFLANLIANGFYLLFFIKTFLSWRPVWDKPILSAMARYAYPIMITGLAGITNELFGRWALVWWLPENFYSGKDALYALGVFSVAYKYAIIMSLAIQAFRFAADPFFFTYSNTKNHPALFAKTTHWFIIFMSFVFLSVVINLDILKYIVGNEQYYAGLTVVPMLLAGYLFLGVYYNFSIWFKLADKTHYGMLITVCGMLITIGFNFIFIPIWGYLGSSWAMPICYFFMAAACYLTGQRHFPIPYKIRSSTGYFLLAIILAFGSRYASFEHQWQDTVFHAAVLIVFLLFVYIREKKKPKIFFSP